MWRTSAFRIFKCNRNSELFSDIDVDVFCWFCCCSFDFIFFLLFSLSVWMFLFLVSSTIISRFVHIQIHNFHIWSIRLFFLWLSVFGLDVCICVCAKFSVAFQFVFYLLLWFRINGSTFAVGWCVMNNQHTQPRTWLARPFTYCIHFIEKLHNSIR